MPTVLNSIPRGRLALLCLTCAILACAAVPASQRQALTDLRFIQQTLAEHHPAFALASDDWTTHWASVGLARAEELVAAGADASTALRYYVAGFADSHLSVSAAHDTATDWAGIQLHYDGRAYRVVHTASPWPAQLPPLHSHLVACDGRPVEEILRTDILPLRIHNDRDLFPRVWYAPDLLIDRGYLHRGRPSKCEFSQGRLSLQIPLFWGPLERGDLLDAVRLMNLEPYQLQEVAPGIHWLSLPSFSSREFPVAARATLTSQIEAMDTSDTLVFDLRGNTGGNSVYGFELARSVYGADYLWARNRTPTEAWWRVSGGNLHYIRGRLSQSLRAAQADEAVLRYVTDLANAIETALQAGQPLVLQPELEIAKVSTAANLAAYKPTGAPRVFLLTDAYCMSACLDFMEVMLLDPTAVHIGQETGAETAYTEVRSVALPSGAGILTFPQKVYTNRLRDRSAVMRPTLTPELSLLDTKALQNWVVELAKERAHSH